MAVEVDDDDEALDAALANALPPIAEAADTNVPTALTALLSQAAWDGLQGCSLWLHAGAGPSVQPALPRGAAFAALFRPN